ncbi:XRE family transcriptional regulator [Leptospira jelokensis]|uniref:XRE family transcriptional regulator n=1 Tax=Leptospira jelokensis TaxID=2484931 RepID=A0A4Z0ZVM4_9LEPT|nr:XRE family transcriptional regulator [Leptospira jelokensis]
MEKDLIKKIIKKRKELLESEASDREALIQYIRQFVESKRGNQAWLANESEVHAQKISNLMNGTGTPPSIETLIKLAEVIIK